MYGNKDHISRIDRSKYHKKRKREEEKNVPFLLIINSFTIKHLVSFYT
jgi:hypothetical protein